MQKTSKSLKKYLSGFLIPEITKQPMLFEVFTDSSEESDALKAIMHIETNVKGRAKQLAKDFVGKNMLNALKKVVKKY